MSIELYVEPRKVYKSWKKFCQEDPYSIGLDGIVKAKTMFDFRDPPLGPYANFDHHYGVNRYATRSTCDQVHLMINMDLFETFLENGMPTARVKVNDCDEDTSISWWLLEHHEQVANHAEPSINRLVYCVDRLDTTAGAYPFGNIAMRRKMAWIFEPYSHVRFSGRLRHLDAIEMRTVIEEISARISDYKINGGKELPLEGHYEIIGGGEGWAFIRETGPAARFILSAHGIRAFVAQVADRENGFFDYVIARRSPAVRALDNEKIYAGLNHYEKETLGNELITPENSWGGSDTVGGSPRDTGSMIPPDKIVESITSCPRK